MKVRLYTTPFCKFCKDVKALFETHNISYEEVDVVDDDKAREQMVKDSGQMGVPVIDIDGEILVGYNRKKLEKALKVA